MSAKPAPHASSIIKPGVRVVLVRAGGLWLPLRRPQISTAAVTRWRVEPVTTYRARPA